MDKHTKSWREKRRKGIGASEVAAILGVSPFKSALEVWGEKVGVLDGVEENEAMKWGTLLEPIILAEYGKRRFPDFDEGKPIRRHNQRSIIFHDDPTIPLFCTPDGYDPKGRTVEAKNVSEYLKDDWSDGPPIHYLVQKQTQLAVMGLEEGTIVALFGGHELAWFDIRRDDDFVEELVGSAIHWWREYVETKSQPPASDPLASRALARLHPKDNGQSVILPESFAAIDVRLLEVKAQQSALEAERKMLETQIKEAIGENTFGVLPGGVGRYSWKHTTRAGYVVDETSFRNLRRLAK